MSLLSDVEVWESLDTDSTQRPDRVTAHELSVAIGRLGFPKATEADALRLMKWHFPASLSSDDSSIPYSDFTELLQRAGNPKDATHPQGTAPNEVERLHRDIRDGFLGKIRQADIIESLKSLFVFAATCYLFTVFTWPLIERNVTTDEDSGLSTDPDDPMDDFCIPWFFDVQDWQREHANNTRVHYHFETGNSDVRVCTDQKRDSVEAFMGMDATNQWAWTGCHDPEDFRRSCIPHPDTVTCGQLLNETPVPSGIDWRTSLSRDGRQTDQCLRHAYFAAHLEPCPFRNVFVFIEYTHTLKIALVVWGIIAPIAMFFVQIGIVFMYFSKRSKEFHDKYLAFAMNGLPGTVMHLCLIWLPCCDNDGERFHRPLLSIPLLIACTLQDLIDGIFIPVLFMWGCSVTRYPLLTTLVVLKVVMMIVDTVDWFWHRRAQSRLAELREASAAKSAAEDAGGAQGDVPAPLGAVGQTPTPQQGNGASQHTPQEAQPPLAHPQQQQSGGHYGGQRAPPQQRPQTQQQQYPPPPQQQHYPQQQYPPHQQHYPHPPTQQQQQHHMYPPQQQHYPQTHAPQQYPQHPQQPYQLGHQHPNQQQYQHQPQQHQQHHQYQQPASQHPQHSGYPMAHQQQQYQAGR